jgi:hypothetical protein
MLSKFLADLPSMILYYTGRSQKSGGKGFSGFFSDRHQDAESPGIATVFRQSNCPTKTLHSCETSVVYGIVLRDDFLGIRSTTMMKFLEKIQFLSCVTPCQCLIF